MACANLGCGPGCGAMDVEARFALSFSWPFVLQATAAKAARSDVTFHPWFMTNLRYRKFREASGRATQCPSRPVVVRISGARPTGPDFPEGPGTLKPKSIPVEDALTIVARHRADAR